MAGWTDSLKGVWDAVDLDIRTDDFSISKRGDGIGFDFGAFRGSFGNWGIPPVVWVLLVAVLVFVLVRR